MTGPFWFSWQGESSLQNHRREGARMTQEREFSFVGKSITRVDAWEKVTGAAIYGVDFKLPGMLFGKILRSPYPHARILDVDTSQAEVLPGVKTVITGRS